MSVSLCLCVSVSVAVAVSGCVVHARGHRGWPWANMCGCVLSAAAAPAWLATAVVDPSVALRQLNSLTPTQARDVILSNLVDVCAMNGIRVMITTEPVDMGWRFNAGRFPDDPDYLDGLYARMSAISTAADADLVRVVTEFNANTPSTGLAAPSKSTHRKVLASLFKALHAYTTARGDSLDVPHVTMLVQAICRLLTAPVGFADVKGAHVRKGGLDAIDGMLRSKSDAVVYAGATLLRAMLVSPTGDGKAEVANRRLVLTRERCHMLAGRLLTYPTPSGSMRPHKPYVLLWL